MEERLLYKTSLQQGRPLTAVHLAAQHGRAEILWRLLKLDPKAMWRYTKDKQTCLHLACSTNQVDIVSRLLELDQSEDHSYVMVLSSDMEFNEDLVAIIDMHRKEHKDRAFLARARKFKAELGF